MFLSCEQYNRSPDTLQTSILRFLQILNKLTSHSMKIASIVKMYQMRKQRRYKAKPYRYLPIWFLLMYLHAYFGISTGHGNQIKSGTIETLGISIEGHNNSLPLPFYKENSSSSNASSIPITVYNIHILLALLSMISIVMATFFLMLILGYLNNVPIAKQCFLLYLYKDVVRLTLMYQWNLFLYLLVCFLTGNEMIIKPIHAKVSVYFGLMVAYQLLVTLNVISIIKFLMKKDILLDPSMPWDSEANHENNYLRIVRFAVFPFLIWLLVMLLLDMHPKIYYVAIGDYRAASELPISITVMKVIWGILLFALLLTSLANAYHCDVNESIGIRNYTRKFPNLSLAFGLKVVLGVISCFGMVFIGGEKSMWLLAQIFQVLTGFMLPIYIIGAAPSLRNYAKKRIGELIEELWFRIMSSFRNVIRISSRVHPIG